MWTRTVLSGLAIGGLAYALQRGSHRRRERLRQEKRTETGRWESEGGMTPATHPDGPVATAAGNNTTTWTSPRSGEA